MPNQPTPQSRRRGQSRAAGHVRGRRKTSTPSATDATRRRPSDSAPGGTSRPRCRIATNAEAREQERHGHGSEDEPPRAASVGGGPEGGAGVHGHPQTVGVGTDSAPPLFRSDARHIPPPRTDLARPGIHKLTFVIWQCMVMHQGWVSVARSGAGTRAEPQADAAAALPSAPHPLPRSRKARPCPAAPSASPSTSPTPPVDSPVNAPSGRGSSTSTRSALLRAAARRPDHEAWLLTWLPGQGTDVARPRRQRRGVRRPPGRPDRRARPLAATATAPPRIRPGVRTIRPAPAAVRHPPRAPGHERRARPAVSLHVYAPAADLHDELP